MPTRRRRIQQQTSRRHIQRLPRHKVINTETQWKNLLNSNRGGYVVAQYSSPTDPRQKYARSLWFKFIEERRTRHIVFADINLDRFRKFPDLYDRPKQPSYLLMHRKEVLQTYSVPDDSILTAIKNHKRMRWESWAPLRRKILKVGGTLALVFGGFGLFGYNYYTLWKGMWDLIHDSQSPYHTPVNLEWESDAEIPPHLAKSYDKYDKNLSCTAEEARDAALNYWAERMDLQAHYEKMLEDTQEEAFEQFQEAAARMQEPGAEEEYQKYQDEKEAYEELVQQFQYHEQQEQEQEAAQERERKEREQQEQEENDPNQK